MSTTSGYHARPMTVAGRRSGGLSSGRDTVEELVRAGRLRFGIGSVGRARALIRDAWRHLASAHALADSDQVSGYVLAHDAACMGFSALLEAQSLHVSFRHSEETLCAVVQAQLSPQFASVVRPFPRLCARRGQLRHPQSMPRRPTTQEIESAIVKVTSMLQLVEQLIPQVGPYA